MSHPMILVTGANGQIGKVLTAALRSAYGENNVLSTDITAPSQQGLPSEKGQPHLFEILDIQDKNRLHQLTGDYKITQIYHLAALLSASGEANPLRTWDINFDGLMTILELARTTSAIERVFFPSTIAVFGNTTPRQQTPQDSPLLPETVYGISKATGELWCHYYHKRYGTDVRSVRYPGIIGWQSMPGGGTTDYAVEIFHAALQTGHYTCFLEPDTRLPMMYMDDAIDATLAIMKAPSDSVRLRYGYNIAATSFTPAEIAAEIQKHIPGFTIDYKPDFRQAIAASWTESIDDSRARQDWGWEPKYDLATMTADMISHLSSLI